MGSKRPELSVVIPVYRSAGIFPELYRRMAETLDKACPEFELIAVVDGHLDDSFEVICGIHEKDPRIKAIELSRNFGHQVAVTAGLEAARGELVIIMDDDLEDPPEILPSFIDKIREGYDVVYGVRRKRKRSLLHRFMYMSFYRILGRIADVDVPYDTGDFCIMRDKVARAMNAMPEKNRYLRGMRSWVGFKQTGLEYERAERHSGEPGYTFSKYFKFAFDGIFSFSHKPLIYVSKIGALISVLSLLFALVLVLRKMTGTVRDVPGWATLVVSISFLSGVQLFSLGLIGVYLGRVYDEVKQRPKYVVNRTVGAMEITDSDDSTGS